MRPPLVQTALGPLQDWCFRLQELACLDLCRNVAEGKPWWQGQVPTFANGNLIECLTRCVLAVDPAKGYVLTDAGRLFLQSRLLPPLPGAVRERPPAFNAPWQPPNFQEQHR